MLGTNQQSVQQSVSRTMNSQLGKSVHQIHDSEVQRLTRELDHFTKMLEKERKRLLIIKDQITTVNNELEEKKAKFKSRTQLQEAERKDLTHKNLLEQQVTQLSTRYNDSLAYNKQLREKIDILRREKNYFQQQVEKLSNQYKSTENMNYQTKQFIQDLKDKDQKQRDQLKTLQKRSEENFEELDSKIKELKNQVNKDKQQSEEHMKQAVKTVMQTFANQGDNFDTQQILKLRVQYWVKNLKEKKKSFEGYKKQLKKIEKAFQDISTATGMNDLQEIVRIFIESQENSKGLNHYISELETEIDNLEEQNKATAQLIGNQEQSEVDFSSKLNQKITHLQEKLSNIDAQIQNKDNRISAIRQQIASIKDPMQKIYSKFLWAAFPLKVSLDTALEDQANVNYTEANICKFLAKMEEYITQLVTAIANQKNKSHAEIVFSNVGHEEMTAKSFNQPYVNFNIQQYKEFIQEFSKKLECEEDNENVPDQPISPNEFMERAKEIYSKNDEALLEYRKQKTSANKSDFKKN